jgi:hypothetical protein
MLNIFIHIHFLLQTKGFVGFNLFKKMGFVEKFLVVFGFVLLCYFSFFTPFLGSKNKNGVIQKWGFVNFGK